MDIIRPMKKTLLQRLGLKSDKKKINGGESELGKQLATLLEHLGEERVRYLAAFGGLLGRVAHADNDFSKEEDERIKNILQHFTDLSSKEAEVVQRIIHENTKTLSGIENYIYTRELNEFASKDKKLEIVSCLFAVAAADDEISSEENESIRLINKALLLTHDDFIAIRSMYKDKLLVMKDLPKD